MIFIVNVVGFAPFAYLLISYLFAGKKVLRHDKAALLVMAAGMGISLLIELLQYDIPGRSSSLTDVIANTMGTALGAGYFLLLDGTNLRQSSGVLLNFLWKGSRVVSLFRSALSAVPNSLPGSSPASRQEYTILPRCRFSESLSTF